MYMKSIRTLSLICAVLLVSACASTPKLNPLHLTVVDAGMTSTDVFSQQFRVRVHVANPNASDLRIKSIDYKFYIEGQAFSEGVIEMPFVVPANGEQEFDMLMQTYFESSIGKLLSQLKMANSNTVHYTFTGSVVVDMTFSPKLNFAETGTVDWRR
jgi:LEA14-like dessication related protein